MAQKGMKTRTVTLPPEPVEPVERSASGARLYARRRRSSIGRALFGHGVDAEHFAASPMDLILDGSLRNAIMHYGN